MDSTGTGRGPGPNAAEAFIRQHPGLSEASKRSDCFLVLAGGSLLRDSNAAELLDGTVAAEGGGVEVRTGKAITERACARCGLMVLLTVDDAGSIHPRDGFAIAGGHRMAEAMCELS